MKKLSALIILRVCLYKNNVMRGEYFSSLPIDYHSYVVRKKRLEAIFNNNCQMPITKMVNPQWPLTRY